MSYRIVRFFAHHPRQNVRGRTCTSARGKRLTAEMGDWFEGYTEEK